jgi:hypothetical protein
VTDLTRGTRAQFDPEFWRKYIDIYSNTSCSSKSATNWSSTKRTSELLKKKMIFVEAFGFDGW